MTNEPIIVPTLFEVTAKAAMKGVSKAAEADAWVRERVAATLDEASKKYGVRRDLLYVMLKDAMNGKVD